MAVVATDEAATEAAMEAAVDTEVTEVEADTAAVATDAEATEDIGTFVFCFCPCLVWYLQVGYFRPLLSDDDLIVLLPVRIIA
jgi:hypothetical protein